MKKLTTAAIIGLTALTLTACGSSTDKPAETKNTVERISTLAKEEAQVDKNIYFKDGVLNTDEITLKILNYQVLKDGDPGTELHKGKNLVVFNFEVTNKSDKDITAMSAWITSLEVIQDNNPNTVNTLSVAVMPRDPDNPDANNKIKKDGTVKSKMAFVLTDDTTPVTIKAHKVLSDIKLGEQVFEVK